MNETCKHPPASQIVSFYKNADEDEAIGARDICMDRMTIACSRCGEVIREAPMFLRMQAEWEAQRRADTQP